MASRQRGKSATEWACEYRRCNETILRLPWEIKEGRQRFCNKSCANKEQQARGLWKSIDDLDRSQFVWGEGRTAVRKRQPPKEVFVFDPDSPKICNKCGEEKERSSFGNNKRSRDGLMHECKSCHVIRTTKKYQENGGYNPNWRFKRHGISKEIFEAMLESQGGGCAVCRQLTDKMCIDHDHAHCSGGYGCAECFRGVLCPQCNMAIGLLKEDQELFERAIEYCSK